MNISYFTQQMRENASLIQALVAHVSPEDARWRPDLDSWSILEVINHLYDEEKEDFRVRLNIILNHPDQKWPPIDPGGWVVSRQYNKRELSTSLENFSAERKQSLVWLQTVEDVDWNKTYEAPFGPIRAGDMFISWVTHDHLHLRQLVELHRALALAKFTPYTSRYAGEW